MIIWWPIVVWDCKLPENNHSIFPHSQMILTAVSGVRWQFWHKCKLPVLEGCEEIAHCPVTVTVNDLITQSFFFLTDPKAPLSTVQLVYECLQQLMIFMHHLYHASFLLDYLVFISAWFDSCWSQANMEKLCVLLLYVHNTHLRRMMFLWEGRRVKTSVRSHRYFWKGALESN